MIPFCLVLKKTKRNYFPTVIVMVTMLWVCIYSLAWCGGKPATLFPQKADFKQLELCLVRAINSHRRAHCLLVVIHILPISIALPN